MNVLSILIAAIELLAPANDAVVQLVPDDQKEVMSKATLEERLAVWNDRIVLYLKDCGITDEEIAAFRKLMLE